MSPSRTRRRKSHKKKSNNKKLILIAAVTVIAVIVVSYILVSNNSPSEEIPSSNKVLLTTSMGNITIQLRDDMPITTTNFKKLVQQGVYDDTIFHRVISGFMIQGGDPFGTGVGDPSIPNINDELSDNAENRKNVRGTISMAKKGDPITGEAIPNSASSQFFINVVNNSNEVFDESYPVFGEVIDGLDVVDAIANVNTDSNDKPLEDMKLINATFVD